MYYVVPKLKADMEIFIFSEQWFEMLFKKPDFKKRYSPTFSRKLCQENQFSYYDLSIYPI